MYRVILVDDEPMVLEQLTRALDWNRIGFELVGTFRNGLSAFAYIQNNPVDAVISDIRMAKMDGLELTKILSEQFPNIKVALISAFRDFDHAKQAMKYDVTDYIIKPITYEELRDSVVKLKEKLDSRQNDFSFASNELQKGFQQLFSDLFCGIMSSTDIIKEELNRINIFVEPTIVPCSLINLHITNFESYLKTIWKHNYQRLFYAIGQVIPYESAHTYASLFRYCSSNIEILIIGKTNMRDFEADVNEFIHTLEENLQSILQLQPRINVIETFRFIADIIKSNQITTIISKDIEYNDIISKAVSYVENNFSENISLDDIASTVNLSPIYFCSYFKQHTGDNFIKYLTNYRMQKARELLANSDIKIAAVCAAVGYKNQAHFYEVFKKLNDNMTPSSYRIIFHEKKERTGGSQ